LTDSVEEIAVEAGNALQMPLAGYDPAFHFPLAGEVSFALGSNALWTLDPAYAHATQASGMFGGGRRLAHAGRAQRGR
jgi:hypothetical protein